MLTDGPMLSLLLPVRGEGQQEVFGVSEEVCLQFFLSQSENGSVCPGAVSQLHCGPDHGSPDVAHCEVLPVLRQHATLPGLTATLRNCLLCVLRSHCCNGMPVLAP
ncbi:unnamed protein product [Pipistrellus nathusii]|uniref:Uncharacterized protein n=1 Tax=Pipistrellus nathusii TaxID=59473 RepID=A0ABP0AJW7_PIPNA